MNYAEDKQYTIPAAFTAMNGAAQTFELTASVDLVATGSAAATAQANLLIERVLMQKIFKSIRLKYNKMLVLK